MTTCTYCTEPAAAGHACAVDDLLVEIDQLRAEAQPLADAEQHAVDAIIGRLASTTDTGREAWHDRSCGYRSGGPCDCMRCAVAFLAGLVGPC